MEIVDMSKAFEFGVEVGVIIILFGVLFFLIKHMIENGNKARDMMKDKDDKLISVIQQFNATILKLNEEYDRNLSDVVESNSRIENKVDKLWEEIHKKSDVVNGK